MSSLKALTIDKFTGVNKTSTETLLEPGEASSMSNWLITDDLKLKKMFGYVQMFAPIGTKINGIWYGELANIEHLVFACGTTLFEHNLSTHANTSLGTIANSFPVGFFTSNNTLYILDGTEYYQWNGSGAAAVVLGYVPTVFTATPPTGGGTILESLNYLTGAKTQKFSGNGSATVYQLAEYSIASVSLVTVNGATKVYTTDYTYSLVNGTITFVVAPSSGVNNVVITWVKTNALDRPSVTKNMYYGGSYYARFWLFGNPDYLNVRYPSGVTMSGVSDPSYFPKYSDSSVGEYAITDMCVQQNKQLIFTDGDANGASGWYSEQETLTDPNTGIITVLFPVFPMNNKFGNIAKGQTRIIMNNAFTVYKGIYQWVSTYISNEKDVQWMSKKIQNDLDLVYLSTAVTFDWDDKGIYIISVGTRVWLYNYRVGAWYILNLPHTPTCYTTINSQLIFGTSTGSLMNFDETIPTYNGTIIDAIWEMGFYNFGTEWIRKFIQRMFVTILPLTTTHIDLTYETDRSNTSETLVASYGLSSFDTWDFSTFDFSTNFSPQPFKFKIRAKKIDYFKLKIRNNDESGATVLSITIPSREGGEVKNQK
jgi:hypothetical protein